MVTKTDVFVVGGGPAGLATAIAACQRGFEVVVADGARPPLDKACGEGLMPDGRAALERLGIDLEEEASHPFRGIRFISGALRVDAAFPAGLGIGIRRTVLHRIMIARAEAAGVSMLWQAPVTGLHPDGVLLGPHLVRSRWVVGADGGRSLVRQWSGLNRYTCDRARFAYRRHHRVTPWTDYMEIHWGQRCQIYVTPVAANEICVALISRDQHLRLDTALKFFPELSSRLADAPQTSVERGAISATRKLSRVYQNRVVLVGDASGAVDAITGEGLCLAFQQSQVLAECFATGNLEHYQRAHTALAKRPAMMARLMLSLDWKSSFRQRVMRAFVAQPRLFRRLLALHVGEVSNFQFAATGVLLGCKLLSA